MDASLAWMTDDTATGTRVVSDREQAFLSLIHTHRGIITKLVRLYVDHREDQRDLTQEIILQAWKSYDRFEGRSAFSTWLYRVTLNTVLTYRRKYQPEPLPESFQMAAPGRDYESSQLLLWAMKQLRDVERMIVALHLEGYDNTEIAQIVGLTPNHVAVKLHRAKKRLTDLIQREEA
ncbi:MAG: RNA polymerase sigma factor [Bacteroidia bacterium]